MEDYDLSRPYGEGMMQIEPYRGPPPPSHGGGFNDFRSYSTSHSQTKTDNANKLKLKKGKSLSGLECWGISDPEIQRKKRVASYKMYGVEGKVRGSFRKSFRWFKERFSRVVYGWS